ncbi:heavy metal translocating P-type ATPase [Macrococcus equipercicus]|uniref:Cadmium-translocating P-type ATPase n=1 Tax=Macrococcus equipercicus TaxID=69967 RepID=A0A9Q9BP49_9STAP|nr:heavy metal translocating P-type ATPase [Macrococcus equipercicus]KAA1037591.1 cadmium-translocating P-type ATPase [Macrococcus equipercicus]UTH14100.1 cadmium-translocating P-type ATPase [Macrococcus equipercicus]
MFNYLMRSRQGQFLLIGILFTILGYILSGINMQLSRFPFYIAIFFLGFYAAKEAVVETIQAKSPNVDLLMILAALGAVVINYESEGAVLLLIFAGAEALEDYASNKSTNAISELMAQVPDTAHVLKANGEIIKVLTDELQVGDIVVVSKGEQIPIDGMIDRAAMVNESALTGEAVPVEKESGAEVFAGTINEGNVFYLRVNKLSSETVFSNIIRMVEEAQNRPSKVSKFIDRIEAKYVIGVLIAVPIFIFILYYFNHLGFQEAFYRGMVLLTVASPCALVASATPATLSAISNGAKNGVLFKGGAAMEALSRMDVLYSDKTGTLTLGEFQVTDYEVPEDVLKEVVYMEQQSSHPIAQAIVTGFKELNLDTVDQTQPVEEKTASGLVKGAIKVGKPSAFAGYRDNHHYQAKAAEGKTTVLVSKGDDIVGYFSLADQVRQESVSAVSGFQQQNIDVILLTGDNEQVAKKVADEVGITHYIPSCLPEDKINYVTASQKNNKLVGMIGDGINDAPALASADIGIAMGSGSSVAMESADVVIVKSDLLKLLYSFNLSRRLNSKIMMNVVFSLSVIVILVILNIFGLLSLPTAVLFHEGSTILVILNGLLLLRQRKEAVERQSRVAVDHTVN